MSMLWVGAGGFFGAIARYCIYIFSRNAFPFQFPIATLLINFTGCFLAGVAFILIERAVPFHRHLFLMWSMGFLGSYTTFSAFGIENYLFLRGGQPILAIINVLGQVGLGVLGVWAGHALAAKIH